jgi:imidazole glycerol-phosphate synthase subunit HisH
MKVAIVDYGAGNLRSVISALRRIGCDASIAESQHDVQHSRAMVLPGVGAAADTMENLRVRGLSGVVTRWIKAERPFLGICMGMQVLFTHSDEGEGQQCLDILPGRVVRLPEGPKIPHMGWNQVRYTGDNPLFRAIPDGSAFYFVHSYVAQPEDDSIIAARTDYGTLFCSAVRRGSLFATQFHPEKSGELGLQLYKNFVEMASL